MSLRFRLDRPRHAVECFACGHPIPEGTLALTRTVSVLATSMGAGVPTSITDWKHRAHECIEPPIRRWRIGDATKSRGA